MTGTAHFFNCILTLLTGGVWLPVWILLALCCGSGRRDREMKMKQEELELLRELVRKNK
jgi:hypothetical protein